LDRRRSWLFCLENPTPQTRSAHENRQAAKDDVPQAKVPPESDSKPVEPGSPTFKRTDLGQYARSDTVQSGCIRNIIPQLTNLGLVFTKFTQKPPAFATARKVSLQ
jgi:hypothetical protein